MIQKKKKKRKVYKMTLSLSCLVTLKRNKREKMYCWQNNVQFLNRNNTAKQNPYVCNQLQPKKNFEKELKNTPKKTKIPGGNRVFIIFIVYSSVGIMRNTNN